MLQMGLIIGAGLLLMLKKEISWIQPASESGIARTAVPTLSMDALFEIASDIPELDVEEWRTLARVDVKPGKGIVKFVSENSWEAQIDTHSGEVLKVAFRRSDIIESLHDGSYFADWVKLYIFLPSGILLFILWGTGIYLFFLPHLKRWQRDRRKTRSAS
jgi:uncharacterized iron-regulated membrane protein